MMSTMLFVVAAGIASQSALSGEEILAPHFSELLERYEGRPIATYAPVGPPSRMYAAGDPLVIFMNRRETAYTCGDDDAATNTSSIACAVGSGIANVGGFSGSDDDWTEVIDCMTDLFAPFRIVISDQEPVDGTQYVESMVGGSPGDAGMGFGVAGVAPYACR